MCVSAGMLAPALCMQVKGQLLEISLLIPLRTPGYQIQVVRFAWSVVNYWAILPTWIIGLWVCVVGGVLPAQLLPFLFKHFFSIELFHFSFVSKYLLGIETPTSHSHQLQRLLHLVQHTRLSICQLHFSFLGITVWEPFVFLLGSELSGFSASFTTLRLELPFSRILEIPAASLLCWWPVI